MTEFHFWVNYCFKAILFLTSITSMTHTVAVWDSYNRCKYKITYYWMDQYYDLVAFEVRFSALNPKCIYTKQCSTFMLRSNVTEQTPGRSLCYKQDLNRISCFKVSGNLESTQTNSYPLMWICFVKAQLTLATDLCKPYNIPDTK